MPSSFQYISRVVGAGSLLALLTSCAVQVVHDDVFSASDAQLPIEQFADLALAPGYQLKAVEFTVGERHVLGYHVGSNHPKQLLLFFPGNGYGAPSAIRTLSTEFARDGVDLFLISYFQPNEAPPTVAQTQEIAASLGRYAQSLTGVSRENTIAVGHSLGGWIAAELAARQQFGGVVLVGTGTDAVDTAKQLIPTPVQWGIRLTPSEDVKRLDNIAAAARITCSILLIGSKGDKVMPPSFSQRIYDAASRASDRRLIVLETTEHGRYFRDPVVLDEIRRFLEIRRNL